MLWLVLSTCSGIHSEVSYFECPEIVSIPTEQCRQSFPSIPVTGLETKAGWYPPALS